MNLEEFVRGKYCSGWKKKRIKPDLRARERAKVLASWPRQLKLKVTVTNLFRLQSPQLVAKASHRYDTVVG